MALALGSDTRTVSCLSGDVEQPSWRILTGGEISKIGAAHFPRKILENRAASPSSAPQRGVTLALADASSSSPESCSPRFLPQFEQAVRLQRQVAAVGVEAA